MSESKEEVGSGFFCVVKKYKSNEQYYAIKILKDEHYENESYRYRLTREIKLLNELKDCEFVVDIKGNGHDTDKRKLWYAMPYYENNLYYYICNNYSSLTIKDKFNIVDQIIEAIKFAHSKNIIHRDLSPTNVLVFDEGTEIKIKVSDFGLGKIENSISFYTGSSVSGYGQAYYVSPEQRLKLNDATLKSDLYSLGKLIYFIFTGNHPLNMKQFELSSLVTKSIEEKPNDRFQDIYELESQYNTIKELQFENDIPLEYIEIADFKSQSGEINWLQFHIIAQKAKYSDHVYYDYIMPVLSIVNTEKSILEYYNTVGSDFKAFLQVFSESIYSCLGETGWPFTSMSTFGNFLKKVVICVSDNEVRLICFKLLYFLAFVVDQWSVQSTIKSVFNKTYISSEIELSLAAFIREEAIEVDMSHFSGLELPNSIKNGIVKSNELYKSNKLIDL